MTQPPAPPSPPARPRSGFLDQPLSRGGCIVGTAIWLCVMLLPCLAFWFVMQREVVVSWGELAEDRFWFVNEGRPKPQMGIGWLSTQVISDDADVDGPVCTRTRLILWIWQGGQSETTEFCECYTREADGLSPLGTVRCP